MTKFWGPKNWQKFTAVHASIHNHLKEQATSRDVPTPIETDYSLWRNSDTAV